MNIARIDCDEITDWNSFHSCFKKAFGFPDFYGNNMSAWIDCMTNLDTEFSMVQIPEDSVLTLELKNMKVFKKRCPEIYDAIIECSAFVNHRRLDIGNKPILILSFYE